MRRALVVMLLLASLSACATGERVSTDVETSGPPDIQFDVVRQHAEQFDVDVPDRPPGSQHEIAAASYIFGHLQLAGYSSRLDRVPVENTLNSTNVVSFPPNGSEPSYLVAVAYDTDASGRDQSGRELGVFLEVARALAVADPDHSVAFVAMGAESDENRGSRRLAQFLIDEGLDPSILIFRMYENNPEGASIRGSCQGPTSAGGFSDTFTSDGCVEMRTEGGHGAVLRAAGFQVTEMDGDPDAIGEELFRFLVSSGS